MTLREQIAKAIWLKRPDCHGKQWPLETEEQKRAYPHNPIASIDLSFIYADAALNALNDYHENMNAESEATGHGEFTFDMIMKAIK